MASQESDSGLVFGIEDDLDTVVASLTVGDKVIVGSRSLPLEVFDTDSEFVDSPCYETLTVYLEGRHGRVYRLRGEAGHKRDDIEDSTPPMLELRQEGEWVSKDGAAARLEIADGQQIMSDLRAGDWLSEAGIDVQ
jgi:hypothetical protein